MMIRRMCDQRIVRMKTFAAKITKVREHAGEVYGLHMVPDVATSGSGKRIAELAEEGPGFVLPPTHVSHELLQTCTNTRIKWIYKWPFCNLNKDKNGRKQNLEYVLILAMHIFLYTDIRFT